MDFNQLYTAAQQHNGKLSAAREDVMRLQKKIDSVEKELADLTAYRKDVEWAYEYLDVVVKDKSEKFIRYLESILDNGVQTIFDDREYKVRILTEEKRVSIHLVYEDEDGNTLSPDIRLCGGGVRTVIGLLLQVFFLFHYKVERLLIIDEGLSQLSDAYLPKLFGLLDELAKNNDLKILLITHDTRMTEYADAQYVVENHKVKQIALK